MTREAGEPISFSKIRRKNTKHTVLESKIIDHITQLKDVEGLSYRSIMVHLSAKFHFFEINDYADLKLRKIKRFLPEDESDLYSRNRPYSVTESEKILDKHDVRDRVAVLFMLSTGMRIGGLRELCYGAFTRSGTITAPERIDITPFVLQSALLP